MTTRLAAAFLAGLGAGCLLPLTGPLLAQDTPPPVPKPAPPAQEAAPDTDTASAAELLGRLERLYARCVERPRAPDIAGLRDDPKALQKDRGRFADEKREWQAALDAVPGLAEKYRAAAGGQASEKAWFYSGFARIVRADTSTRSEGDKLLVAGIEDLRAYLDKAPRDAVLRPDAEHQLAYALIRQAAGDPDALAEAVPHADAAVRAHLENGQADEAGELAYVMLQGLISAEREADAARLASGWDVADADLGVSTENVRRLQRRAGVRPGEPLAKLPDVTDQTGVPMPWKDLAGHPYVLHFFNTVVSTETREIETILVPLREKYRDAGLRIVGCSTDRALTDEELETTRRNWEEWGKKDPVRDGRLASVRAWAEERGVDWPFTWDGRWMHNALASQLGIPVNAPFAILVDAKGVIRWRGEPYKGLQEAVDQLMGR